MAACQWLRPVLSQVPLSSPPITRQAGTMEPSTSLARRLWQAIEPLHAVVYFHPSPAAAAKDIGLKGWWMGYFAGRFAPLGAIGPEAATAMAYGFAPSKVAAPSRMPGASLPPKRFSSGARRLPARPLPLPYPAPRER